jgi:hypothetical protein
MRNPQLGQQQNLSQSQQTLKAGVAQQNGQGQYRMPVGISQSPANSRTQPPMAHPLVAQGQHGQPNQQQSSAAVRSVDDFVSDSSTRAEFLPDKYDHIFLSASFLFKQRPGCRSHVLSRSSDNALVSA